MGVAAALVFGGTGVANAATEADNYQCGDHRYRDNTAKICWSWQDSGKGDGTFDGRYIVASYTGRPSFWVSLDGKPDMFDPRVGHVYRQKRTVQFRICNIACSDWKQ
ncbi:hypothetical protein BS330_34975 [Amycolatopsis keratiniphila subsp. nogabecina]|uniref:Secreted protein n=1 Tax=Amycolatopsis keratiniphila subsp. keratiniphila TaxID=227715 RepID=A0A1W2LWV9_9PSEU|nr:hypothetical protein BS330_34975 [Amycolatopsis keratiniphila subsp. nogabecina]ONF71376.1 hypothetical protein AVR91_0211870 [Amycolatopsis keratiniphila subsp. keratiniphila]